MRVSPRLRRLMVLLLVGCGGGCGGGSDGGAAPADSAPIDAAAADVASDASDAADTGTVQLASEEVAAMTMDGDAIYFIGSPDGTTGALKILRVPKGGGAETTIFAPFVGVTNAGLSIAVDATTVYWTDGGPTVMSAPISGGAAKTLASGLSKSCGVVADDEAIYWSVCDATASTITKTPKAGGAATTLTTGTMQPRHLRIGAEDLVWTGSDGSGPDKSGIYAVDKAAFASPRQIAKAFSPSDVLLDGADAWWADFGSTAGDCAGAVQSAPLAGGAAAPDIVLCHPLFVALDPVNVWVFVNGPFGTRNLSVLRVPRAGGATTALVSKLPAAGGLLVDDRFVYYGARGVFRLPR